MQHLKQYHSALAMAIIAIIVAVVGGLMMTIFAPEQKVVATTQSPYSLVMSRDKVLPLKGSQVTITATSSGKHPVALVLGTTADVRGWIGDMPYGEIVGLESGLRNLKMNPVAATSQGTSGQSGQRQSHSTHSVRPQSSQKKQSGRPQSGRQQSGISTTTLSDDAYSVDELANNDMWIQRASGDGKVTLKLTNASAGLSIVAAVAPSQGVPTVTMSWSTPHANTGAIIAWIICAVFLILAVIFAITKYIELHRRSKRTKHMKERQDNQSAPTEMIELPDSSPKDKDVGTREDADKGDKEAAGNGRLLDEEKLSKDKQSREKYPSGRLVGTDSKLNRFESVKENKRQRDSSNLSTDTGNNPDTRSVSSAVTPEQISHSSTSYANNEKGANTVKQFPTRRAMKEARKRGDQSIIIEGHEFKTGAIPIVHQKPSQNDKGDNE